MVVAGLVDEGVNCCEGSELLVVIPELLEPLKRTRNSVSHGPPDPKFWKLTLDEEETPEILMHNLSHQVLKEI